MVELPSIKFEVGFLSMLTLIFITLKLTHYINWSWWYVLAPMWVFWVLVLAGTGIVLIALGLYAFGVKKGWW